MTKISWAAVAFAIIGASVQPFAPLWLFLAVIITSLILTGTGMIIMQRRIHRQNLMVKMDEAFGTDYAAELPTKPKQRHRNFSRIRHRKETHYRSGAQF